MIRILIGFEKWEQNSKENKTNNVKSKEVILGITFSQVLQLLYIKYKYTHTFF